jgi:hypothetical protein
MTFSIFDDGNLVASLDDKAEATAALARLVEAPEAAEGVLLASALGAWSVRL